MTDDLRGDPRAMRYDRPIRTPRVRRNAEQDWRALVLAITAVGIALALMVLARGCGPKAEPVTPMVALAAEPTATIEPTSTATPVSDTPLVFLPTPSRVPGTIDIAWLPPSVSRWAPQLIAAGQRHSVDPALLALVCLVESGGNPHAVSSAGAIGLMQVMPSTGADIARRRRIEGYRPSWLYNPDTSIDYGAWYLADLLGNYGQADDPDWRWSVALAAVGYNCGPGCLGRWLEDGMSITEQATRYRGYVSGMWAERYDSESPTYQRWLDAGGWRLVSAAEGRAQ